MAMTSGALPNCPVGTRLCASCSAARVLVTGALSGDTRLRGSALVATQPRNGADQPARRAAKG